MATGGRAGGERESCLKSVENRTVNLGAEQNSGFGVGENMWLKIGKRVVYGLVLIATRGLSKALLEHHSIENFLHSTKISLPFTPRPNKSSKKKFLRIGY